MPTLFGYYRSSSAFRVRIALNLKGVTIDEEAVNLLPGKDEQLSEAYKAMNPQGRVPLLVNGDFKLSQSLAIIDYIEQKHPEPALLPADDEGRAIVMQLVSLVCADMQPLCNLAVLKYLKNELGADQDAVNNWYHHWMHEGFTAYEGYLKEHGTSGAFSYGDAPTFADVFLLPQVWNARRFNTPMDAYPLLTKIEENLLMHEAFVKALPENQPDAPKE